ncbi:MAG: DUF2807 domain-containing protein [Bacteroidetes bacterium]|nr:DUF2807 domain-containing protein [Bacteroidota bacterium]
MKILKIITIVLILFSSCKKENRCDCIKRTGEIITEIRTVPLFDRLFVEQDVNVFLTQDSVTEVKVEAGENIAPLIQTVVEEGVLIIRNKNRCNWARSYNKPLNVYIKTPGLKYIHSNGSGNIKSLNTITKDTFDVRIEGSGDIDLTISNSQIISHIYGFGDLILHGSTKEHLCSIGGSSFLYAADLYTYNTWIQSYTLGECYLKASSLLTYRIDDKGDIYSIGIPPIIQKTSNDGEGKLIFE